MTDRIQVHVSGDDAETVENALTAINEDDELPDIDRTRGPTAEGMVSTGAAVALLAEAYTGWSA